MKRLYQIKQPLVVLLKELCCFFSFFFFTQSHSHGVAGLSNFVLLYLAGKSISSSVKASHQREFFQRNDRVEGLKQVSLLVFWQFAAGVSSRRGPHQWNCFFAVPLIVFERSRLSPAMIYSHLPEVGFLLDHISSAFTWPQAAKLYTIVYYWKQYQYQLCLFFF